MKNFRIKLIVRILLLAASIGFFFYLIIVNQYRATIIIAGVVIAYQVYSLIRFVDLTNRELKRFFDSVKFSDFSQTFTRRDMGGSFSDLHNSLNQVIGEFQKTRNEREEQFRFVHTVMQHVGVGLITFTQDGRVEFINNTAKKIFRVNQLYSLDQLDKIEPGLSEKIIKIKPGEKVTLRLAAESETQQLIIYAAEFKLKDRVYTLVSLQNILAELEEKEMQAWQNLIRVLTHEIMNSVTPISSLSATINKIISSGNELDHETMDDIRLAMETIQKRSEALIHFVDVYRTVARTPEPVFEVFRIRDLLNRIEKLMEPELKRKNVELKTEIVPETLDLTADPELVEQVLINLMLNALQSFDSHASPEIILSAHLDSWGKVNIRVEDNGPGIPDELHEKIFIPFFTTRKKGSGIGLSLSRQIMRSHGGSIRVVSKPGKGAGFILRF